MQHREELWHYALYRIGHEHLVAVELDLVPLHVELVTNAREVEDAREREGVVHIQVDVEERRLSPREQVAVELLVVLRLEVGRPLGPERVVRVDDVGLIGQHLFPVLPLALLAAGYRHREESAVLLQQLLYPSLL